MERNATLFKWANGFTLVELLVVIGIISLLAAILMPSLEQSLASARSVYCMNNLKQIGVSTHLYTGDNRGWVFPANVYYTWRALGADGNTNFLTLLAYLNYLPQGNIVFRKTQRTYDGIDYSYMVGLFGTANPRTPSNPLHYCPERCVLNDRALYLASYVNRFVYASRSADTYYNLDTNPITYRTGVHVSGQTVRDLGAIISTGLSPSRFVMWGDTASWCSDCDACPYPYAVLGSGTPTLAYAVVPHSTSSAYGCLHLRHNRGGNAWFADGHAANLQLEKVINDKLGIYVTYGTYNP